MKWPASFLPFTAMKLHSVKLPFLHRAKMLCCANWSYNCTLFSFPSVQTPFNSCCMTVCITPPHPSKYASESARLLDFFEQLQQDGLLLQTAVQGTNYYEAYTGIELPLKKHLSQLTPATSRVAAASQLVAAGCRARNQLLRSLYRH